MRNLVIVLGDQLDLHSEAIKGLTDEDVVWMAEVDDEATHVWCHKMRIADSARWRRLSATIIASGRISCSLPRALAAERAPTAGPISFPV